MKSPVRYLCGLAEQRNAQSAVFCILGVLLLLLSSHLILAVSPGEGSFARSRSAIAQENPLQDDIPVLKLYHSSTGGRQRRGLPWKNSDSSSVLKEDAGDWHAPLRRHSLDETVLDKSAGRKSLGQGIVKSVSTRAKRDHDQEHCNRTVSPAVIHCALSGKRTASLLFGSSNQPVVSGLKFGDARSLNLQLVAGDSYFITDGNETVSGYIGDRYGVPCNSLTFIVIDETEDGHLHVAFYIFYSGAIAHGYAGIVIYNALRGISQVQSLDVIAYNAQLVGTSQSAVWRLGSNMQLTNEASVIFPPGSFEFKIVPHSSVAAHCGFQNTKSITSWSSVDILGEVQYFLTLGGVVGGDPSYSPRLIWSPPSQAPSTKRSLTQLVVMNAYRSHNPTSLTVIFANITRVYAYSDVGMDMLMLQHGDCVRIASGNASFQAVLEHGSHDACVAVPQMLDTGGISCFLHCYDIDDILAPPGFAELFIYNAMDLRVNVVDIIAYGGDNSRPSLLSVQRDSCHDNAQSVLLPVGQYLLKVVPNGTVYNIQQFHDANSLAELTHITIASQLSYYMVLLGSDVDPDFPAKIVYNPKPGNTTAAPIIATTTSDSSPASSVSCSLVTVTSCLLLIFYVYTLHD